MRLRLTAAVLALLAVGLAAGCGGGGGGSKSAAAAGGASVAPKSTAFLLQLDTDFDGGPWQTLDGLLKKFPDGTKLYSSIAGKGADFEQDVKPALGPETDVLALTGEDLDKSAFVSLTQPRDPAKFQTMIAKDTDHPVTEEIERWEVIADDRATIDRFKRARNDGTLADSGSYKDATAGLPGDALARLYVDGAVLTAAVSKQLKTGTGPVPGVGRISWLSGAMTATETGFGLELRLKGDEIEAKPFASELLSQVPADVLLALDFKGLDAFLDELRRNPAVEKQLGGAGKFLGTTIDDLVKLFAGEGALYVRSGTPSPEITLVLKVDDEAAALATVDKLVGIVALASKKAPEPVTVAGVDAKRVALGKTLSLVYAAFDGKLVVTTAESGIDALKGGGEKLAAAQGFKDLQAAAAMPDETAGFLYANVRDALPLIDSLMKKKPMKPETRRNLEHLGATLLYGTLDGNVASLKGFVTVQ